MYYYCVIYIRYIYHLTSNIKISTIDDDTGARLYMMLMVLSLHQYLQLTFYAVHMNT